MQHRLFYAPLSKFFLNKITQISVSILRKTNLFQFLHVLRVFAFPPSSAQVPIIVLHIRYTRTLVIIIIFLILEWQRGTYSTKNVWIFFSSITSGQSNCSRQVEKKCLYISDLWVKGNHAWNIRYRKYRKYKYRKYKIRNFWSCNLFCGRERS